MRATADKLRRLTSAIVKAGGSAAPEADLVSDYLVRANLMEARQHNRHSQTAGRRGTRPETHATARMNTLSTGKSGDR